MSQWQSVGYVMLLFCVAIRAIPRDLYEAAACDGAGRIRTFFNVTVPLVRQMTTLMTVITISGAFLVFNEVMVTTGGGPGNASHVLGTWLYQQAFLNDDMGYAATIATVLFALTTITGALQLLWVRRRAVEVAP
jgi:raffinose/stachyose/melibiose transport system permease protein